MQKNKKIKTVKVITTAAMLAAISAVIGILCKNLFTYQVYYRFTLENAPIILAGLSFGPVAGAAVGVCADTVSCLMSTNPALHPIISLGAASVGAVAGLVPFVIRKKGAVQTVLAVALAHLIGQVGIKSIAKIKDFGMPVYGIFIGLGFSALAGAFEVFVIKWLRSQKELQKYMVGSKQ